MKHLYKHIVYNRNTQNDVSSHRTHKAAQGAIDKTHKCNPDSIGWRIRRVPTKGLEHQIAIAHNAGLQCGNWYFDLNFSAGIEGFEPPKPGTSHDCLSDGDFDYLDRKLTLSRAMLEELVDGDCAVEEIEQAFAEAFRDQAVQRASTAGWIE